MTITRPASLPRCSTLTLLGLLLGAARPVAALPPNHSISLQGSLQGPAANRGGGARPALGLAAAGWLDGAVEATARLSLTAAPRTGGRPAAATLAGLRWAPDGGRWRPGLGIELGVAWPAGTAGPAVAAAARATVERLLGRQYSVSAGLGLAWEGRSAAPEGLVALTCYF